MNFIEMDSSTLYDIEGFGDIDKQKESSSLLLPFDLEDEADLGIDDLNPNLEFSVDIQQLIDSAHGKHVEGLSLFPELQQLTTSPDTFISVEELALQCSGQLEDHNSISQPQLMHDGAGQLPPSEGANSSVMPADFDEVKEEPISPDLCSHAHGENTIVFDLPEHLSQTLADLTTVGLADLGEVTSSSTTTETPASKGKRNPLKATPPSKGLSRKRAVSKDSNEYKERRERNNVAVRKSRDKTKEKQKETEKKVKDLTEQNDTLQKKVDLLSKELAVLKGLFVNVGAALPPEVRKYFK